MNHLPADLHEARALRDAARAVLADDLAHLRRSLKEESVASRVTSSVGSTIGERVKTGARDVVEQAKVQAGDHGTLLAALIGAIVLWLAREPLLAMFFAPHENAPSDEAATDDYTRLGESNE